MTDWTGIDTEIARAKAGDVADLAARDRDAAALREQLARRQSEATALINEIGTVKADLSRAESENAALKAQLAAPAVIESTPTRVGDLKVTKAGERISNLVIRGQLEIAAPDVIIDPSVIVRGPKATTSNLACIKVTDPKARNYLCSARILPEYPSARLDGVRSNRPGRFLRQDISGTVDAYVLYGDDIVIERAWVHDLITYAVDPNQGGTPSHSDAVMVQGGARIKILHLFADGPTNAAVMVTADESPVTALEIRGGLWTGPNAGLHIGKKNLSGGGWIAEGMRLRGFSSPIILNLIKGLTVRAINDADGTALVKAA